MFTLAQIADCVSGKLVGNGDLAISQLCIDSRKIQSPEQSLFFAIKTDKNNGNLFVEKVLSQGVKAVVVSEKPTLDCNYILVQNSLVALQNLAAFHRRQFDIPIIGIITLVHSSEEHTWKFILFHCLNIFGAWLIRGRGYLR